MTACEDFMLGESNLDLPPPGGSGQGGQDSSLHKKDHHTVQL